MLLPEREQQHDRRWHWLRVLRDAVEVVAIVAAGAWAFYVFAYENRIKPSQAPTQLTYTVTMEKGGTHDGLTAIKLKIYIKNIGTVRAHFLAFALWITGEKVEPSRTAREPQTIGDLKTLNAFYTTSSPVPVFGYTYLTHLADPKTGIDFSLDPGNDSEREALFYVPAGRFDLLEANLSARFTKFEDKPIPVRVRMNERGIPVFDADDNVADNVVANLSQLDLH